MKLPRAIAGRWSPRRRARPAPFVVGPGRSGTTLLRLMLDAHGELAIPPETYFVPDVIAVARRIRRQTGQPVPAAELVEIIISHPRWPDFKLDADELRARVRGRSNLRPALRSFYSLYAESQRKERWGDKTPPYGRSMPAIQEALPEAHFVQMIRDGRAVALSRAAMVRRRGDEPPPAGRLAAWWKNRIEDARRQALELDHYQETRYEELILDPEATLRRICAFIDLDFDPAMLSYHERSADRMRDVARDLPAGKPGRPVVTAERRLGAHQLTGEPPRPDRVDAWRHEMSDADRREFERVAGPLLAELGYPVGEEVDRGLPPRPRAG